jgi:serine/threonine protein phosphatase PrpC
MKCPECGRSNREGAGYCAWCGHRLEAVVPDEKALPVAQGPASEAEAEIPEEWQAPEGEPFGADDELDETEDDAAPEPDDDEGPFGATPPVDDGQGLSAPEDEVTDASSAGVETPGNVAPSAEAGEDSLDAQDGAVEEEETGVLGVGDVLAGRYEIVEVLEAGEVTNHYRARDLTYCVSCEYDDNAPGAEFCASCGATLDEPRYVAVVEQVQRAPRHYDVHFRESERDYFVTSEPMPEPAAPVDAPEAAAGPIRLTWGYATDQGLQRDHNEDYVDARLYTRSTGEVLGLFVVADGLGGQDSGEVASQMATEAVWEALRASVWEHLLRGESLSEDEYEARLAEAVVAANRRVYDERTAQGSDMSTTLTLAMIVDDVAYVGNVGDSRTYVWNAQGLQPITRDHSLVQRLVDAGQLAADEVYTHPRRNVIYQSIGDRPDVQVDVFRRRLVPDDRLILCSDGLWEMVRVEGLEEVLLSETDPQRVADRLVSNANLAGGEDNITVIVVQALPGR